MTAHGRISTDEATRVGERIDIDWASSSFDVEQLRPGMEVELEHGARDPATVVTGDDPVLNGQDRTRTPQRVPGLLHMPQADGGRGRPRMAAAPPRRGGSVSDLAHLRVYRFEPGAAFEGGLLAAIERMQLGGDAKLLDALFVRRDAATGALDAVDLAIGGGDATFASLLDFRLDPVRRRAITERTLAEHPGGVPRPLIEAIAGTLQAGAAIFALLDTGGTATVLEDAVARSGGQVIADEPVNARALAQAGSRLRAAVGSPGT